MFEQQFVSYQKCVHFPSRGEQCHNLCSAPNPCGMAVGFRWQYGTLRQRQYKDWGHTWIGLERTNFVNDRGVLSVESYGSDLQQYAGGYGQALCIVYRWATANFFVLSYGLCDLRRRRILRLRPLAWFSCPRWDEWTAVTTVTSAIQGNPGRSRFVCLDIIYCPTATNNSTAIYMEL